MKKKTAKRLRAYDKISFNKKEILEGLKNVFKSLIPKKNSNKARGRYS